ncbi:DUF1697 domain-containing protein [Microbacterium sp. zg.Y1090]|uniref:DUF1697 domain-containing protein n=1 Tax=Microbacterium wangruii TaxID=3049073 RepID=UPI00214C9129|nr:MULTISPECIES: DUF1697 domain-containing protein [unclassified Microbacterium]MCR2817479.1 DUF1697 domain-containing protein [Microbacterium sp. zg.Y1090]WIM29037.1 DUF1697 domain-containing protein [Microbacterium sp. zg-Y1090]
MDEWVGFLRNVNQGQRGHPSTADILAAFADAGVPDAVTFQSNGTVVFRADDPAGAVADAVRALEARTGLRRDACALPLSEISRIVDAHAEQPDAARREVSFHADGRIDPDDAELARVAAHRRCRVVDAGEGWVVSVNERAGEGNATPTIEDVTGEPATSRGLPTLVRLLARFGAPD